MNTLVRRIAAVTIATVSATVLLAGCAAPAAPHPAPTTITPASSHEIPAELEPELAHLATAVLEAVPGDWKFTHKTDTGYCGKHGATGGRFSFTGILVDPAVDPVVVKAAIEPIFKETGKDYKDNGSDGKVYFDVRGENYDLDATFQAGADTGMAMFAGINSCERRPSASYTANEISPKTAAEIVAEVEAAVPASWEVTTSTENTTGCGIGLLNTTISAWSDDIVDPATEDVVTKLWEGRGYAVKKTEMGVFFGLKSEGSPAYEHDLGMVAYDASEYGTSLTAFTACK